MIAMDSGQEMRSLLSFSEPSMTNASKRILVFPSRLQAEVELVKTLLAAGLDVTAAPEADGGDLGITGDHFDLVLICEKPESDASFDLAAEIRRRHPELPVVMVLHELALPLVVKGIRHGLTDVWPGSMGPESTIRKVKSILCLVGEGEPTVCELAEAEATLAQLDASGGRDRSEAEITALQERLEASLQQLQAERDLVAAAQAAVDEKARLLAKNREAMQRETRELAVERRHWEEALNELEEREEAMRLHEVKLREKEEKIAAISAMGAQSLPGTAIDLAQAWESYHKAAKTLAADKAAFRDERMALVDLEKQLKEGKAQLREIDQKLAERGSNRGAVSFPPPPGFGRSGTKSRAPMKTGFIRSILGGAR